MILAVEVLGQPPLHANRALEINLHHLDWLRRAMAGAGGAALSTWIVYAAPDRHGDVAGPYHQVEASGEGIGCVDDVARAAIVYLQHYEATGDPSSLQNGREALKFVRALAAGDGTYYNFIHADGRINTQGTTSHKGLTWWTARALWATAVGIRVLRRKDPDLARELSADADRTLRALEKDLARNDGRYEKRGHLRKPAWFADGAPDVTAVFVIGLVTLDEVNPRSGLRRLIQRYAEAIAEYRAGDRHQVPFYAHLPSDEPKVWHSYGAHMLHALALAGQRLGSRALIDEARREADHFTVHLLISGGPIAGFFPALTPFPQLSYGVEPQVLGLLELARVTSEVRYARMAGLMASWLCGNNVAATRMYDPRTGRCRDGIDKYGPSDNSGAESTIEALLTLQALRGSAAATEWAMASDIKASLATRLPAAVVGRWVLLPGGGQALLCQNGSGHTQSFRPWAQTSVRLHPGATDLVLGPAPPPRPDARVRAWSPSDAAADALVDVARLDPTLVIEMRYATTNNFLKKKVYDASVALLRRGVAVRLVRVQAALKTKGLGLKIWDAYRPLAVQFAMWKLVPDTRFVANPEKGSVHSRGAALDVTLVDSHGHELDMGTDFNDFSSRAFPESPLVSAKARAHRRILRRAMEAEGFRPLNTGWWHFAGPAARQYPPLDVPIRQPDPR